MSEFDLLEHHRKRTRLAEARADGFERELAKAYRLLGLAVTVAAGDDCNPVILLAVLEEFDSIRHRSGPTIEALVTLLRETDPAAIKAAA